MKQIKINQAYGAFLKLLELKFPIRISREIYKQSNILKEHYEFFVQEQDKIIQSYHGRVVNANGLVNFDGENAEERSRKCFEELNQLNESDVEIEIKPILITETDYGDQIISPSDIGSLDGFIVFE